MQSDQGGGGVDFLLFAHVIVNINSKAHDEKDNEADGQALFIHFEPGQCFDHACALCPV